VAPKELKALRLLIDHPKGLYGSEFVVRSEGYLGRGTIYTLLERLVEKGFVKEVQEEAMAEYQLPRTRHVITGVGRQAVNEYCDIMGMQLVGENLA
jgi:predicted transcriptional regulator